MTPHAIGENALIELRHVTRTIGDGMTTTLVKGINLKINNGEFVAIIGASGSGKSSLLYLLGLLDAPTSGEVFIKGRSVDMIGDDRRAFLRLSSLGFVFQFHFLLPEFSALANVMLPMRALKRLNESRMRARAMELLSSLGLEAHADKLPSQLSGGERQRVAIARALANQPMVLLADEPTGNLDSASGAQVLSIFRRLVDDTGSAIVMVTHDLSLAAKADRQIQMSDGLIVGGPADIDRGGSSPSIMPT